MSLTLGIIQNPSFTRFFLQIPDFPFYVINSYFPQVFPYI